MSAAPTVAMVTGTTHKIIIHAFILKLKLTIIDQSNFDYRSAD